MRFEITNDWVPEVRPSESGRGFFAFHPYLPGVNASGNSEAETRDNWKEAVEMFLDHCREHDLPVPTPNRVSIKAIPGEPESQDPAPLQVTFAEPCLVG